MLRQSYSPVTDAEKARMKPVFERLHEHNRTWSAYHSVFQRALPLDRRPAWKADQHTLDGLYYVGQLIMEIGGFCAPTNPERLNGTPATAILAASNAYRSGPPEMVMPWNDTQSAALYVYLDEHADLVSEIRACLPARLRFDSLYHVNDRKGHSWFTCLEDKLIEAEVWIRMQYRLMRDRGLHRTPDGPFANTPAGYIVDVPAERTVNKPVERTLDDLFL